MEESTTSRLLKQIKEVCELAGAKTEEYARISRKRLDVMSLGRELAKEKTSLGERVLELSRDVEREGILEDATVQAILDRLSNLEGSLRACEEEIKDIQEVARERVADVRKKYEAPPAEAEGDGGADDGDPGSAGSPAEGGGAMSDSERSPSAERAAGKAPAEEPK